MKNLFDFDAQANQSLYGGQAATQAAGLPVPGQLPGSFAPNASNDSAAMLDTMRQRTQALRSAAQRPAPQRPAQIGYNPETQEFFSQGKVFKADLNEGRQAAAAGFFDMDNPELPAGFEPVYGEDAKAKLQKDFESQGLLSDVARRAGTGIASVGSALRDLGAPGAQAIEQYGADIAARNPSQIQSAGDILDKPLTAAGEAVGEAGVDLARVAAGSWAGAKLGGLAGAPFGPAGASIGAILGGAAGIFLPSVFETYGSVRREQREQGIDERGRALAAATGSAALDTALGPEAAIARMTTRKVGAAAAKDLLEAGAAKAIGKQIALGAATEGPLTEVPQEAIERWGAQKALTGEEALNNYLIAGFKGAVGGAAMSTVTGSVEYQQAKNFANNLLNDQQIAADPSMPGPVRLAAARRVQDVLRGASDDPQFDQQLQEFRQKLARLEANMASMATREALEQKTPLSLIQDRPAFYQTGEQVQTTAPSDLSAYAPPPPAGRAPRVVQPVVEEPAMQVETAIPNMGPQPSEIDRAAALLQDFGGPADMGRLIGQPWPDTTLGGYEARGVQPPAGPITPTDEDLTTLGGFEYQPPAPAPAPLSPTQQNVQSLLQSLPDLDMEPPAAPAPAAPAPAPVDPRSLLSQNKRSAAQFLKGGEYVPAAEKAAAPAPTPAAPASAPVSSAEPLVQIETRRDTGRAMSPERGRAPVASPAAPVAAGTSLDTPQERAKLRKILDDVDSTPLESSVESPANMRVPGRASLTTTDLQQVRDALMSPRATVEGISAKAQKLADAARAAAKAYFQYLNAGGNLGRMPATETKSRAKGKEGTVVPTKFAELTPAQQRGQLKQKGAKQGETVQARLDAVTAAMAALGEAAGNNAKNVEAVVRLVKDMAQNNLVAEWDATAEGDADVEGGPSMAKLGGKLDAMLSQLWSAAKYGMFTGGTDQLYVRQQALRESQEMQGAGVTQSPIERAAEGTTANYGKGETYSGMLGVMTYIEMHGTPFERKLAAGVKDALYNSKYGEPSIEFITSGNPSYDPNTNTIRIRSDESVAVTLHESLHAALQWFIYNNPNHESVKALKASLKQVVSYKGDLPAKAKAVQDLLKKLVKGGNELDAVLELVSYGNTLIEFRKAMQAMPSKGVPKTFFDAVNNLWQSILTSVRALLGSDQSVAADVIANTFKLLEAASTAKSADVAKMTKAGGNVLESAIRADADTIANSTTDEVAKIAGYADASEYRTAPPSKLNLTRTLLQSVGIGEGGRVTQAIEKGLAAAGKAVRKNMPDLERTILLLAPNFSSPNAIVALNKLYKTQQNTAVLQMEYITDYIHRHPDVAGEILDYLDGNETALDKLPDAPKLKTMADLVLDNMRVFINALPADSNERKLFDGLKFTEYLLHPQSVSQLAGKSFGQRALGELLAAQTRNETSIEEFKQFMPYKNGVLDSDKPLYQIFETLPDGKRVPWGFIDKARADSNPPAGLDIDTTRIWKLQRYSENQYKFVSRSVTGSQVREMAKAKETDKLSAALLNTVAALSHNYASRNFFNGLAKLGYDGDTPSAQSVIFDTLGDINAAFGTNVTSNNVLPVSADEARMYDMRHQMRRTGTWVQLPKDEAKYGPLAGKYMPGPVWNAMLDMHDRNPMIHSRAFNNTMTLFKKAKTVYSPATHVNNILSNYALMLLHGISHRSVGDAAKLLLRFETAPKSLKPAELALVKAFYDSGAVLGQFSSAEAKETIAKAMMQELSPDADTNLFSKLGALAKYESRFAQYIAAAKQAGQDVDTRAMAAYAFGDNVFRFAAFLQTAGDLQARDGNSKLTTEQLQAAGIAARNMFLDYDIDSRMVRAARQSVLPFVSWTYAVLPVLGRIALHKPWALVNMVAALAIMEAVLGGEDDEELRKKGPEYLRERAITGQHMFIRLPFLGDDQNPVYYNIGKSIPFMSVLEPSPAESKLFGQSWVPGAVTPGGPFVSLIAAVAFGIDPFTGKTIHAPTDGDANKLLNTSKAVYDAMVPPPLSSRNFDKAEKLLTDTKSTTGREPDAMFLARAFGLSAYGFNVDEQQVYQSMEIKKIKRDYTTAMRQAAREEARKGVPDYAALDETLADLRKRMEKAMAEAKGEE